MKVMILDFASDSAAVRRLTDAVQRTGNEAVLLAVKDDLQGCIGCGKCWKKRKCIREDAVNEAASLLQECEGMILIVPEYYRHPSAASLRFLQRLYYSASDRLTGKMMTFVFVSRNHDCKEAFFALAEYPVKSGMTVYAGDRFGLWTGDVRWVYPFCLVLRYQKQGRAEGLVCKEPVICSFREFVR